jgi:hypothetical protein
VSSILVIIGIVVSFYQSKSETESISSLQQTLTLAASMTVTKNLDPLNSNNGVYEVQMYNFKDGDQVKANVIDSVGNVIITRSIAKSPFQENFTISHLGNYTLQVQNIGRNETQILGIIGYYPQGATFIDVFGFIVLISGLSGLAIGMMYLIKRRGKADVS